MRFIYGFLLIANLVYLYYMDYNIIILLLIVILNSLVIIGVQIRNSLSGYYFLPEIIINFIYYFATFMIKRDEIFYVRDIFFESFKNEQYINYIHELINTLNIMVIGIKRNEILFINNFFKKFLNENNVGERITKENHILLTKESVQENCLIKINNQVNSFFNSLICNPPNEQNSNQSTEGKPFQEILIELFSDDNLQSMDFKKLGNYIYRGKHFDISVRKPNLKEDILEVFIKDISEIKIAEKNIIETKFKQKILAKLAHEFKTPLIIIISLIKNIMDKENFIINEISIKKNLHHINNFSNYTISLISDIIQYASNSADIRFNKIEIYLRDAMEFTFNVLKTLVECNENKVNKIELLMEIDEKIDSLKVFTDENRLKQILLNLVSNAVKFTISGYIKIKAQYIEEMNIIEISVNDSGFGIKEEDNHLIFQETIQLNINQEYNIR